jgi:DnaJ-class molecular chaperone
MFNTIPRGDLYVQIAVQGMENFAVHGIDLYTQVSVNCLEAIVGKAVVVEGIDGRKFELSVAAGTQPNTKYRIPQQGLYHMNSHHRGDLYVEVAVSVPKDLPEDVLEAIRSLVNT